MKFVSSIVTLLAAAFLGGVASIEVGETFPKGLKLHHGFPPESISLDDRVAGKNVLIVGLPGAFTPT